MLISYWSGLVYHKLSNIVNIVVILRPIHKASAPIDSTDSELTLAVLKKV